MKGPILLAANHPNSFLDAIILDILFEQPIWSLARGDVFKKPFYARLLVKLNMLPVYRTSEGVENLDMNYKTFDACKSIFRNNGIVLMFSEGRCINEWHLRPLKKGTARLAISSWDEGINLKVLPVGINYSSFSKFGKNVFINFGNIISNNDVSVGDSDGKKNIAFNSKLQQELQQLVFEISKENKQLQKVMLEKRPGVFLRTILFFPALAGFILNAPLYLVLHSFTVNRTKDNDHHDSVLTALLVLTYPFYLMLISVILFVVSGHWLSFFTFLVLPFMAWSYIQVKPQLDK